METQNTATISVYIRPYKSQHLPPASPLSPIQHTLHSTYIQYSIATEPHIYCRQETCNKPFIYPLFMPPCPTAWIY